MIISSNDDSPAVEPVMQISQAKRRLLVAEATISSMADEPINLNTMSSDEAVGEIMDIFKALLGDGAGLEDSRRRIEGVMARFREASRDDALADLESLRDENQQLRNENQQLKAKVEQLNPQNWITWTKS